MAIQLPAASRQAACDAIVDLLDGGTVVIYTGSAPDPDVAATGTLLGTLTFGTPAFGAADTDGIATANAITQDSSADNSGTPGYFRCLSSGAANVYQGSAGVGSGDLNLSSAPVAGEPIQISSLTLQVPQNQS